MRYLRPAAQCFSAQILISALCMGFGAANQRHPSLILATGLFLTHIVGQLITVVSVGIGLQLLLDKIVHLFDDELD